MPISTKLLLNKKGHIFTISSDLRFLSIVDRIINHLLSEKSLSDDLIYQLKLLLSEIITNAIVHGNKNDLSKRVVIRYQWEGNSVRFQVFDQGSGFDIASIPDPTSADRLTQIGGRGVFLTKKIANTFGYCNFSKSFSFTLQINE